MLDCSVVIVARDQPKQLLGTLLSLKRYADPAEVLLVDNASSSSLAGPARLSQSPVTHLRLDDHVSLSAAFNFGLDRATRELVLLLHSDTILLSDAGRAFELMRSRSDVGVVGGKLMTGGDPPWRVRHAGYDLGRGRIGPTHRGRGDWDCFQEPVQLEAVSDACMFVRRSDVRFDERYWFRLQDVDFCLQHRQRGLQVLFDPDLLAVHTETGGVAERSAELQWASRQLASNLLYHERWCSNAALETLGDRTAVRGEAAQEHLRRIDARYAE